MAHLDWDAQAVAASMRDEIMLNDCQVPIVDEDGKVTGKALRVTPPTTRKVDEGIVQLSLSFDVYFQPEAQRTKMQKFYLAWQNAKQEIQNRRLWNGYKKSTEAADSAETTVEKPANVVKKEPKYAVGKLREKSILLFGVSQSTFDGAMYGHTEEEYTKKEVEAIINEWLYGKEGKK